MEVLVLMHTACVTVADILLAKASYMATPKVLEGGDHKIMMIGKCDTEGVVS